MFDKEPFYKAVRADLLGPTLSQNEVDGCEAILSAFDGLPLSWCAYALATAYHETNRTMQPVREAYWLSEDWRKRNLRYYPWYGRGFVQITWERNYKRADDELALGGSLLSDPDRAMEPDIAARIMRRGMTEGWFTGRNLSDYLPERLGTVSDYEGCRRIINGADRAHTIAIYAMDFQQGLLAGNWP